jgi:hypothetical protein
VTQQADKPSDIGRNFLPGNGKKGQIFNEDFYLPLYLPLWLKIKSMPLERFAGK